MKPDEIGAIFDATAEEFVSLAPHLWDPIGAATVRTADVRPGERVLDVCCGAGASALPAAVAAGPEGAVDAIDLAESLLAHGRRRADAQGLANLRFIRADATTWQPGVRYDAAICVHGVFFLPDMDATVKRLIGLVRPGGRFAVTTWAKGALEQYGRALHAVIEKVRGAAVESPSSRDSVTRIDTDEGLAGWLTGLGLADARITRAPLAVPLTSELAWLLVTGSGFRGMLTGLDADAVSRVRDDLFASLEREGLDQVDASVLIGIGHQR
ncbi:methyltransferase domain-containing protein [Nonomuraea longispora]|uniref:Methyltransferase domain-containing protein n=1 Tax=Nonomuraea longispora TaxID=1848320 RepID=A0A4R4NFY4_9ACTN|nr:class I SAM-dependent methyltransferase [Nonomuraea longispora]TDC07919.1 methyltransferase domain-containing protein [Nonomuraea longispora]